MSLNNLKQVSKTWLAAAYISVVLPGILGIALGGEATARGTRLERPGAGGASTAGAAFSGANSRSSLTVSLPAASNSFNSGAGKFLPAGATSFKELFSSPPQSMSPVRSLLAPSVAAMFPMKRLQKLDGHDLVVLVDKSSSMRTGDAPGGLSRWDWTQRQLSTLSSQLGRLNRSRLDVVLFDNGTRKYPQVKMADLPAIFSQNSPGGGTNVTRAMKSELDEFFNARRMNSAQARPLVMAVITDGAPSSARSLKDLIVNSTHKIESSSALRITFLQVGSESQGNRLIPELDNDLVNDGAKFDIVRSKSFPHLIREGLVNALIDAAS